MPDLGGKVSNANLPAQPKMRHESPGQRENTAAYKGEKGIYIMH